MNHFAHVSKTRSFSSQRADDLSRKLRVAYGKKAPKKFNKKKHRRRNNSKKNRQAKEIINIDASLNVRKDFRFVPMTYYLPCDQEGRMNKVSRAMKKGTKLANVLDLHNVEEAFSPLHWQALKVEAGEMMAFVKVPRTKAIQCIGGQAQKIFDALEENVSNVKTIRRGKKLGDICTTFNTESVKLARYVSVGQWPYMNKHGLGDKWFTKTSHETDEVVNSLRMKHCHLTREFMPYTVNKVFEEMRGRDYVWNYDEYGINTQPGMVIGESPFLSLHVDADSYVGTISIHCSDDIDENTGWYGMDGAIIAYFVFPTLGYSVPLRAGDFIIFNAKIYHCLSMPTTPYVGKKYYCCSSYLKQRVAGLNDNRKVTSNTTK